VKRDNVKRETSKALVVHQLLSQEYGEREWRPRLDPLSELIFTILSQNTSDVNRDRAWRRLKERFSTWESVLAADAAVIAEAIRPGGLADIKAPRIQEALRAIKRERGELTVDFLAEMEVDQARRWLTSLNGVGPKTAAIVLLFSLGKPAFPVDTHVRASSGPRLLASRPTRSWKSCFPPKSTTPSTSTSSPTGERFANRSNLAARPAFSTSTATTIVKARPDRFSQNLSGLVVS